MTIKKFMVSSIVIIAWECYKNGSMGFQVCYAKDFSLQGGYFTQSWDMLSIAD